MSVAGNGSEAAIEYRNVFKADVARQYEVERITVLRGVREEYYAISEERRIRNPAVAAITGAARKGLFVENTDQRAARDQ